MDRIQIKEWARAKLKGNLARILGAIIIAGIASAVVSLVELLITERIDADRFILQSLISIAFAIISLLLLPLNVGLSRYLLHIADGVETNYKTIFEDYNSRKRVFEEVKAFIVTGIYIVIGFILLIIPGIVLAFKYSQLTYVFADDPDLTYKEAMTRCGKLMEGRKWEFFVFELSFIGWVLLGMITLGIAYLYLAPYEALAAAKWYREKTIADAPSAHIEESKDDDYYRKL